ncbi:hypothetical protein [Nocardioides sp.]|uniref:hypothetical protein n=1 Tax=Nocardioides sp. TaxID=35761 RepID=UPI0026170509|nr:hypothetical protein [Nocardioides sp.]MDI6911473.1 hypothetical protein [Nocardioides sp.]
MGAIPQVRQTGPKSYPALEAITGGQLVEGRATGTGGAGVAAAGSAKVLGVALNDAVATLVTDPVNGVLDTAPTGTRVNVAKSVEVPVTYAAAAAFGDKLVAAANGHVTPAGATPDARTIVGECTEVGGVAAADTVALAWIY